MPQSHLGQKCIAHVAKVTATIHQTVPINPREEHALTVTDRDVDEEM